MAPHDEHEFQWNIKGEPEPESVLDTLASLQKDVAPEVRAGEYLVEIGSDLKQLQEAYLSAEQRAHLAAHLRAIFLYFQRLTPKFKDKELRAAITNYLALVGAVAVTPKGGEPFTLIEALATNEVARWADCLYTATRDADSLAAEQSARRDLMRRLELE